MSDVYRISTRGATKQACDEQAWNEIHAFAPGAFAAAGSLVSSVEYEAVTLDTSSPAGISSVIAGWSADYTIQWRPRNGVVVA